MIMSDLEMENEAIDAAMPAVGTFISFDGNDDCLDCRGWDGRSGRCECGNRRVCWAVEDGVAFGESN
jgi:hypothetical protein